LIEPRNEIGDLRDQPLNAGELDFAREMLPEHPQIIRPKQVASRFTAVAEFEKSTRSVLILRRN
jgi:hypothetical protein